MTIEIVDWNENFEISESRRHNVNKWLPLPNKMDGLGFRRLVMEKDKHIIFSAWILLIQLASKMPVRGILESDTGPLDYTDMEVMTGFPAKSFKTAVDFLKQPKIGWIRQNGDTQSRLRACYDYSTEQYRTRQYRT